MAKVESSVASYVDAYVVGWARSRGASDPEAVDLGWYIPTGPALEPERYVLTSGTVDDVRRIQARLTKPGSGIKFAGRRSEWLFLVDAEWAENPLGWFMAADIGVVASAARRSARSRSRGSGTASPSSRCGATIR